ncbi:hypothetical protein [Actinomadura macra]|uniref:hypothetical protein n=1 Tax=Actinomadura macra TaxID=46164 RepID=UPI00082D0E65|nr:hypothetical protein [Actinomadura macra]
MADTFDGSEHLHAYPKLYALMSTLQVRGFTTDLRARSLTVTRPGDPERSVQTITCRPRVTDADRLWFFDGSGEPIAEAEDITGAAVIIAGNLTPAP